MVKKRETNPKGLKILSTPLFSKIVYSNKNIEIIGAISFSPGLLNQTVVVNAREKQKTTTLKNPFFTKRDNKTLSKQERNKYIDQKKIIKTY